MCVEGQVSLIWLMLANRYMAALRTTSTYRLTLCGTSKLPVMRFATWIDFNDT